MKALSNKEIKILSKVLQKKNYVIYEKPFQLNIVGRRTNSTKPNSFDDWIYIFYKDDKKNWVGFKANATTDTGTYWLNNPINKKGSALLKEGQYKDIYKIDLHNGKYYALTQRLGNVTVYRDYNRDSVLDFNNGREETGSFGINIHRANSTGTTKSVDKNSAGCQVFASADDFNEFMKMANRQKDMYGNVFTYTLIDERAYVRRQRLRAVVITSISFVSLIGLGFGGYFLLKKYQK